MGEHSWRLVTSAAVIIARHPIFDNRLFNTSPVFLCVLLTHIFFFLAFARSFFKFVRTWERQRKRRFCCLWPKQRTEALEESLLTDREDSFLSHATTSMAPSMSNLNQMLIISPRHAINYRLHSDYSVTHSTSPQTT